MKITLNEIKRKFDNYILRKGFGDKGHVRDLILKLSKVNNSCFQKTISFNMSQKTKSKNNYNNNFNSNSKNTKENKQAKFNHGKSNKKEINNINSDNIQERNKKANNINNKDYSKIKETNTEKFLNFFNENFPLELNKKKSITIDTNLTCFVPYDQIVNRVKAVSIGKTYLGNLVDSEADFSDICEDNFFKLIRSKLDNLKDFNIEDDDIIKYDLSFNKSFKKVKFLVNLHNIKNFMCIGYDPSKEVAKNLKNFQHLEDHIIENPFSQFKELKQTNKLKSPNQPRTRRIINTETSDTQQSNESVSVIEEKEFSEEENPRIIETIKCDLIINRDFNGLNGLAIFNTADELQRKYEELKISLISHFHFSIIIEKLKESDDPLKLVLNIKDELDDISTKREFEIEQIDFICQAEILKINYKEYQESIRIIELMEKKELKKLENDEVSIDGETGERIEDSFNLNDDESEQKINTIDHNQISDILKNLSFLKNMAKTEKLKIVNVDGINKNYNLI